MNFQDDFFKREVQKSIDEIKVPESIFTFAKELPYKMEEHAKPKLPRKSKWKKWLTIAAASVTIGISAGAYLSPTFAAYIKSFFVRPDLDEGLQTAAKEGFSEKKEYSVTDNGITLKVKEVMADTNRLILTYSLENENGEFIDPTILFESEQWAPGRTEYFVKDLNAFYITDKDGDIVSRSTNYGTKKGRFVTQHIHRVFPHHPYADLMFELNHSAVDSKQLFANITINKIGSIEGKWNLKVPVHIEKSMMATKTLPVDKQYVTREGLAVTFKNVVYSPTLTSLNFETKWTEKGKQLIESHREYGGMEKSFHRLLYDIIDSKGNIVATTFPKKLDYNSTGLVFSEHNQVSSQQTETIHWRNSFIPLPKGEKLTFVFRGIERMEYPNKSITFHPTKLNEKPVSLDYKGNLLTIQNFKLETNKDGKRVGILEIEERIPLGGVSYELSDEKGNILEINYKSSSSVFTIDYDEHSMTYRVKNKLEIEGIEQMPKQLTLTLKTATVLYKDENWKVPIPSPSEK
ncbi:DUF4179 domain-containing protein [Thermolongibacillus altinsuensis]|uniref:DUF4179 domain-containing protein n=1 Tax=Thermolongibacillus altinsuensis TaxID=575256 RepID=UPI00242A2B1E|nr:DUF4179 domain-containing protein [Thermolongibacillus altinsuensis]GMB08231.1 hypothetical protein B1no1_09410 [Thermolongibacillus altinsuensis]